MTQLGKTKIGLQFLSQKEQSPNEYAVTCKLNAADTSYVDDETLRLNDQQEIIINSQRNIPFQLEFIIMFDDWYGRMGTKPPKGFSFIGIKNKVFTTPDVTGTEEINQSTILTAINGGNSTKEGSITVNSINYSYKLDPKTASIIAYNDSPKTINKYSYVIYFGDDYGNTYILDPAFENTN